MKKTKTDEIIIHRNQSSIFDIIEDTTGQEVPESKSKLNNNKDWFKDTIIVNAEGKDNYLVLHKQDKGVLVLEFYVKNKDGSYNMFSPKFGTAKKIVSTTENGIRHFLLDNVKYINYPLSLTINLSLAYKQNDIMEIFKLLKQM